MIFFKYGKAYFEFACITKVNRKEKNLRKIDGLNFYLKLKSINKINNYIHFFEGTKIETMLHDRLKKSD